MKIKDLKRIIQNTGKADYYDDCEVVIPISKPSIGGSSFVETTSAGRGIDWNNGKFFIRTKERLVQKSKEEDLRDMSRDLLMYLATKPMKRRSYESEQACKILLRAGYTQEQLNKYQHLFHKV